MNDKFLKSSIDIDPSSNQKEFNFIQKQEEIPLTFKDFTSTYSWPNMGSLRKMAYESESNGLAPAFVKFKKRRLVLPQTLFRILKEGGNS